MKRVGLLCIAMLFLCGTASAERTIWYVHPDSALNTIQAGLDSCADNDIVLVGPGTYYENIIWPNTQGIHLISELGSEVTTIDGDSIDRVITITSGVDSTTIIREFTVQNGCGMDYGGGIYCDSSSPIIAGNIIRQNSAVGGIMDPTEGGGICCKASSPIIRYNTIIGNRAAGCGAGIHCDSSSSPVITANIINENSLPAYALCTGGGIYCSSSSTTISDNTISDNWPEGIACESSSSLTISGNTISNNGRYGIWFMGLGSPVFIHNIVIGNGWGWSFPAGIHCCGSSSPIIDSCTISCNLGDGVYCHTYANPIIHYSNIIDNSGYGICSADAIWIDAEDNWWGDATGPYHPTANPGGLGNSVSDYVDFEPWLSWPVGVEEQPIIKTVEKHEILHATIFRGPLQLPEGKKCKVFDVTGRVVEPDKILPGIYFIEIDGVVTQKVIKIR